MATRELLTRSQRLRLDALPVDLDDRLMARYHTLSEADIRLASRRLSETNRLGFGAQLCLLRYPGRPLRPKERAPEKIVRHVASQIGLDPGAMESYAGGPQGEGSHDVSNIRTGSSIEALTLHPPRRFEAN